MVESRRQVGLTFGLNKSAKDFSVTTEFFVGTPNEPVKFKKSPVVASMQFIFDSETPIELVFPNQSFWEWSYRIFGADRSKCIVY
jgi:hypothetical protein